MSVLNLLKIKLPLAFVDGIKQFLVHYLLKQRPGLSRSHIIQKVLKKDAPKQKNQTLVEYDGSLR
jgi:hypothetical protein